MTRRRRAASTRLRCAAAARLVVVLVVGLAACSPDGPADPTGSQAPGAAATSGASPASAAETGAGAGPSAAPAGWRALPESPLDPRWGAFSIWTGDRLVVWGGYAWDSPRGDEGPRADGASYADDGSGGAAWEPLPDGPLPPVMRHDGVAVWTGAEVLIAGGTGGDDGRTPSTAAAAYQPDDASWRALPDLPAPIAGGGWVGGRLVVIGADGDEPRPVYALRPDGGRWERLDPLPAAGASGDAVAAAPGDDPHVQVGDDRLLVVIGGRAWLLTPEGGWRSVSQPQEAALRDVRGTAWDGDGFVVVLPESTHRYEPGEDRWTRVAGGLTPAPVQTIPVVRAADGRMVAIDLLSARVHTLTEDGWRSAPALPADRVEATAVAADDQVVVWGGMGGEAAGATEGWALDITTTP